MARVGVVQEGSALFFRSPASMAAVSSGAGFYSGPIASSILVAGYCFKFAPGGPCDLAGHAHLETLARALLSGDGDIRARAGDLRLERLSIAELQRDLGAAIPFGNRAFG